MQLLIPTEHKLKLPLGGSRLIQVVEYLRVDLVFDECALVLVAHQDLRFHLLDFFGVELAVDVRSIALFLALALFLFLLLLMMHLSEVLFFLHLHMHPILLLHLSVLRLVHQVQN